MGSQFQSSGATNSAVGTDATAYVTQDMVALQRAIEQLLGLLQGASRAAQGTRERLDAVRQRGADKSLNAAQRGALERERQSEGEGLLRALEAQLATVAELGADLREAREQLERLQNADLPLAEAQDLQTRLAQGAKEQERLEQELGEQEALAERLAFGKQDAEVLARLAAKNHDALHTPLPKTHLDPGTAAAGGPSGAAHSAPGLPQKQLDELAGMIKGVVASQATTPGGAHAPTRADALQEARVAKLQGRWGALLTDMGPGSDPTILIQQVMRQAYVLSTDDLRYFALRVRFYTELKKKLRAELNRARVFQSKNHRHTSNDEMDEEFVKLDISTVPDVAPNGDMSLREASEEEPTRSGKVLKEYIKELEDKLTTVGDDAQLAQVDLQSMSQRQQQTLQTLSNLSKVMHETSMAIIRKIGS